MRKKIPIGLSVLFAVVIGTTSALAQISSDRIVITWTASNLRPSHFEGRVLPTFGSPVTASVEATRNSVLLDLSQADITWEEAVELVKSCEVKMVAQNHNRGVHLSLKDGTERTAIAPELDSIIGVGISCGDIIYAIE